MLHSRVHIEAGDLVIVYMSRDNMVAITITPGEVFHNKYGRYPHDDFVGVKFGSKAHSPAPHAGYIYLLRPTPELWTLSLPHRTQILYTPDIAYITMRLGVRVGGTVIEAGTGSGSMTHSLARTVGPKGDVRSFEYHRVRYEKASAEFESHGLSNVHLQHRNVCKDGFGDVSGVEAVFLDLPAPWEAIPHAMKTLRPDTITKICCFSPCLEQVLKTVAALRAEGFSDISTQEVLVRTHDLAPPPPAGSSHLQDISSIVSRLKSHEKRKAERRIFQMKTAREKARKLKEAEAAKLEAEQAAVTETMVEGEGESEGSVRAGEKRKVGVAGSESANDEAPQAKRPKAEEQPPQEATAAANEGSAHVPQAEEEEADGMGDTALAEEEEAAASPIIWTEPISSLSTTILTKPHHEMRGHTSYLTFASLYPASIRAQIAEQGEKSASRMGTPAGSVQGVRVGTPRVAELVQEAKAGKGRVRAGSEDTEYGSEGIDAAIGTLTEDDFLALSGPP